VLFIPWPCMLGGWALGLALRTLRWRRRVVRSNLSLHAHFLGAKDQRGLQRLIQRSYDHLALAIVTLLGLPWLLGACDFDEASHHVPQELLDDLTAGPVIFCSAHLGLWELLPHFVARLLPPSHRAQSLIVYRPLHNATWERVVLARRRRCGMSFIPAANSLPHLMQALRNGASVGLLADQRPRSARCLARFMDRREAFEDGLGRLHASTGRPVWFVALLRDREDMRRVHPVILRLAPLARAGSQQSVSAVITSYADVLSACVSTWPDQYLWLHNRWKLSPRTAC